MENLPIKLSIFPQIFFAFQEIKIESHARCHILLVYLDIPRLNLQRRRMLSEENLCGKITR